MSTQVSFCCLTSATNCPNKRTGTMTEWPPAFPTYLPSFVSAQAESAPIKRLIWPKITQLQHLPSLVFRAHQRLRFWGRLHRKWPQVGYSWSSWLRLLLCFGDQARVVFDFKDCFNCAWNWQHNQVRIAINPSFLCNWSVLRAAISPLICILFGLIE